MSLILIVSVVLINLVTAVIVNRALEYARQDKEARKIQQENYRKRLVGDLKEAITRLDTDEDGTVSIEELLSAPCEERGLLQECMRLDDLLQVFCVLDTDGDGKLDIEELCDGILYAVISDSPIELKRMEKHIKFKQRLTSGQSGSLWGELQHGATMLWGKYGMAKLRPFIRMQHVQRHDLNVQLESAIQWWMQLLMSDVLPREVLVSIVNLYFFMSYSDGEGTNAGVGVAVWGRTLVHPIATYLKVPRELRLTWAKQRYRHTPDSRDL